jgi:hypothetical protein
MSYDDGSNESARGFYGEGYPFFSVTRGAANLISEYARFYFSSISKLPLNIALAKQTQGRKEEEEKIKMTWMISLPDSMLLFTSG